MQSLTNTALQCVQVNDTKVLLVYEILTISCKGLLNPLVDHLSPPAQDGRATKKARSLDTSGT